MLEWLVTADDRTGALEVAGEIAASSVPVEVVTAIGDLHLGSSTLVMDIGTRHLPPELAAQRILTTSWAEARRRAHKIDSTLRGNWAAELVADSQWSHDRVLVVAALPLLGRTCRDGVVMVHGEPTCSADARRAAVSARPLDHLAAAGADAGGVVEVAGPAQLAAWLDEPASPRFAICDASTDAHLAAIGTAWAGATRVRFAGTSASIGAAWRAASPNPQAAPAEMPPVRELDRALVICGSVHPLAMAQVEALRAAIGRRLTILTSAPPLRLPINAQDAGRAAADLAAAAEAHLDANHPDVVVIVGGDTAAAVLGDAPRLVGGVVGPGMPWSRRSDGAGPLVVTKAGGFGTPTTLVELLLGRAEGAR